MFFYSSTIDRIQGYLDVEEISPGDYANYMVEELESQIVKIGKKLSETTWSEQYKVHIPGSRIKEFQYATLKCFQLSPKQFLTDAENFDVLTENMKVQIIKGNLMKDFQTTFDYIFIDKEFGFKADDQMISLMIASLEYVHIYNDMYKD